MKSNLIEKLLKLQNEKFYADSIWSPNPIQVTEQTWPAEVMAAIVEEDRLAAELILKVTEANQFGVGDRVITPDGPGTISDVLYWSGIQDGERKFAIYEVRLDKAVPVEFLVAVTTIRYNDYLIKKEAR